MRLVVLDIIEARLKEEGYDGLYNPDYGCACKVGDLAPCEDRVTECVAGYEQPCPGLDNDFDTNCPLEGECEWHIGAKEK